MCFIRLVNLIIDEPELSAFPFKASDVENWFDRFSLLLDVCLK
jgi:hypothetical protein